MISPRGFLTPRLCKLPTLLMIFEASKIAILREMAIIAVFREKVGGIGAESEENGREVGIVYGIGGGGWRGLEGGFRGLEGGFRIGWIVILSSYLTFSWIDGV